jgi:hypothetical protein
MRRKAGAVGELHAVAGRRQALEQRVGARGVRQRAVDHQVVAVADRRLDGAAHQDAGLVVHEGGQLARPGALAGGLQLLDRGWHELRVAAVLERRLQQQVLEVVGVDHAPVAELRPGLREQLVQRGGFAGAGRSGEHDRATLAGRAERGRSPRAQ